MSQSFRTLVCAEFFLPQVGGSINWLLNTYSRYPKDSTVLVAPYCPQSAKIDASLPFAVKRLPSSMPPWAPSSPSSWPGYIKAYQYLCQVCSEWKIQQIHCAKVLPEGIFANVLHYRHVIPYIVYAHGEEIQICQTSRILSWLMPRVYNNASAIIANSTNTKKILTQAGVKEELIHIIHPGVNVQDFIGQEIQGVEIRHRYKLKGPVLLTVGRLQRRKGQDMVIRALVQVKKEFKAVKYLIVGSGEEETYLKNLCFENGLAEHVVFTGQVPDWELPGYYAACDLFVMPNRQIGEDIEGFGMVYLEAGAAGKPVIGGKSGGTQDAILDEVTGLRVNGEDVEELSMAISAILRDPNKAKYFGENGRQRVVQKFTWDQVYLKTHELATAVSEGSR